MRTLYRKTMLPIWWEDGFAFWFAEQVVGQPQWRPESRALVSTPEPAGNVRLLFGQDEYYRLSARYYWEVCAVIEQGLLPEVLRAPLSRINEFRPKLEASVK